MVKTEPFEITLLQRSRFVFIVLSLGFLAVIFRLFYWQVLQASRLQAAADNQYSRSTSITGSRGLIYTSDNYPLVANETVYRLFAQPKILKASPVEISALLTPILEAELPNASSAAEQKEQTESLTTQLTQKLSQKDKNWVSLFQPLSRETK